MLKLKSVFFPLPVGDAIDWRWWETVAKPVAKPVIHRACS
jgi:hypothetical protein